MKKSILLTLTLLICGLSAWAQQTVSGVVTEAESGESIPGVNVIIKGGEGGTITDFDGAYSLTVEEGSTLIFSFIGLAPQEIQVGSQTQIDVALGQDVKQLTEVVVTALGISRDKASLGYSVQEVGGSDLAVAQTPNAMSALSGKVAGVQVSGGSSMGGSSRVLIRGAASISGNNQPLYIVDGVPLDNSDFNDSNTARGAGGYDYGNMAQDINPDDIESMSVLKGPSAAALYGARAANGVILITTKKGSTKQKGIGVDFKTSVTFEKVNWIAKMQNQYGGGSSSEFDTVREHDGYKFVPYYTDESWGPKFNGQQVVHWDGIRGDGTFETREWRATPNDIQSMFDTGVQLQNSIALSGGNEQGSFRLAYTNLTSTGYMPNSEMDRNTFNFSGDYKFTDKLKANASMNYIRTTALGRPMTGYDNGNIVQSSMQWSQRQLDYDRLRDYKNPDGSQRAWNRTSYADGTPAYTDNPYWTRHENYQNDERDRYYGTMGLTYELAEGLNISGKAFYDAYTFRVYERVAVGSQAQSSFGEDFHTNREVNLEAMISYTKQFGEDWNLSTFAGVNRRDNYYRMNSASTVGGLLIPNLYNVTNGRGMLSFAREQQKRVNSVFGSASIGWKNMVYVDATLRNDWSSTLPSAHNSFLYPSITTSFVFSELEAIQNLSWLDFGKVRFGWAQVGNDTDPYRLMTTYANVDDTGADYMMPTTRPNTDLKPETTRSWEVGLEMSMFDNRVTLDATYYTMSTFDQILAVPVSASTGYTFDLLNAGTMRNYGVELALGVDVIRKEDFNWHTDFNFSRNRNQVVELADGIDNYRLASAPFNATVNAFPGSTYGAIMGTDYVYDGNGNRVLVENSEGEMVYAATETPEVLGSILPDFNLGIRNSFRYKNFDASVLIDMQKGGSYFSTSYMFGMYSGMYEETAANGIRETGMILPGVYQNESGEYVQNDRPTSAYTWGKSHFAGPQAQNVFDATYIKLREISIGYTFPNSIIGPFQAIRVGAYGRNLAIWGLDNPHFDPETAVTSSGNVQGIEGGALPPTATFGFDVSVKF